MTAASDLDLILLYDYDAATPMSDGKRPLAPAQYYARLTQRLVAALSAPTAEGIAYEVDLPAAALRQVRAARHAYRGFAHYQPNEAWTWEHMALTRGRADRRRRGADARGCRACSTRWSPRRATTKARRRRGLDARSIEAEKKAAGRVRPEARARRAGGLRVRRAVPRPRRPRPRAGRDDAGDARARRRGGARRAGRRRAARPLRRVCRARSCRSSASPTRRAFRPRHAPEASEAADGRDRRRRAQGFRASARSATGVASFEELEARLVEVQAQTRAALESVLGVKRGVGRHNLPARASARRRPRRRRWRAGRGRTPSRSCRRPRASDAHRAAVELGQRAR